MSKYLINPVNIPYHYQFNMKNDGKGLGINREGAELTPESWIQL